MESKSKYQLLDRVSRKNIVIVTIKGDYNDGDYSSQVSEYSIQEFDEEIVDVLILLQNKYGHRHGLENFPSEYREYLDLPRSPDGGCHTLADLTIEYIDEDGRTWDVSLPRED